MPTNSKIQTLLVTGGAGFIGSNFIRTVLAERPQYKIINCDKLTYAGNLRNLEGVEAKYGDRYQFVRADICDAVKMNELLEKSDSIIHLAAESHVDRSILDAASFVETNVKGTLTLLNACLSANNKDGKARRFVHVSTDEVYGTLSNTDPAFTEETPLTPNSPYSASKASSDFMVRAFVHTHKLDAVTTRCSNNYGCYQFPEKLIPLMISNAHENQPLPVYGKGENIRDWIHVLDHNRGVLAAFEKGKTGEVYNLGGKSERKNIDVVKEILKILGKPESLIRYVEDRKGHDWRYAIDCTKAEKELGWKPSYTFEAGLKETVHWYLENEAWWREVKSGAYREFYEKYYGKRV